MDVREGISGALRQGTTLMARYLLQGTSLTLGAVLTRLDDDGPARLTALAAAIGVSQPTMTQPVGRSEREGLILRLIDPDDARATLVAITDDGRALRAELVRSQDQRLGELLDSLSPDEEATLALAMRVALPLLQRLTRLAAQQSQPQPAIASP